MDAFVSEMDVLIDFYALFWVVALGCYAQLSGMFEWRPCGKTSGALVWLSDHKRAAMSRTLWNIYLYLNRE